MATRCLALALLAALAASLPVPAQAPPPPPLTNEDVVRMVSSGRPEAEILRIIAASTVDFELDREMTEELRRAGVTEKILAAMRERQAEAGVRHPETSPASSAPAARGSLGITFLPADDSGKNEAALFQVVRKIPRWAMERMGMEEKAEVEDLALFVACTTPDHVPDHWQDRTAVKDFARHEMLLFHRGSRPDKAKGFDVLTLDIPPGLSVDIPAGTHRLAVGVAMKVGADWHPILSDTRTGVVVEAGKRTPVTVRLKGRLMGTSVSGFKEDQGLTISEVGTPGGSP